MPGAWLRDEGSVFLSFGGNTIATDLSQGQFAIEPNIYAEYGLLPWLTLGVDAFAVDSIQSGAAFGFATLPLGQTERLGRFAVSLGLGQRISEQTDPETLGRVVLHWGLGVDDGWRAADLTLVRPLSGGAIEPKLDLTWGYRMTDRISLIAQGHVGRTGAGDDYGKLTPSVLFGLNDTFDLQLGVVQSIIGPDETALSANLWLNF